MFYSQAVKKPPSKDSLNESPKHAVRQTREQLFERKIHLGREATPSRQPSRTEVMENFNENVPLATSAPTTTPTEKSPKEAMQEEHVRLFLSFLVSQEIIIPNAKRRRLARCQEDIQRIEKEEERIREEKRRLTKEEERLAEEKGRIRGTKESLLMKPNKPMKKSMEKDNALRKQNMDEPKKKTNSQVIAMCDDERTSLESQVTEQKIWKKRKMLGGDGEPVKKRKTLQYGGGSDVFKKNTEFPTKKEMKFFQKFTEISTEPRLKRQNAAYEALEPMRIKFKGVNAMTNTYKLQHHVARLIDIFIRKMIKQADGNLTDTKYWIRLTHSGYAEKDGFYVNHKTYANVDGGVIVNMIAAQMQSNKELRLDESFGVAMNVFTNAPPLAMIGRGPRKIEKLRNDILKKNFGIKNNRVIGSTHCLPKALALGMLHYEMSTAPTAEKKKELETKLHTLTRSDASFAAREMNQLEMAQDLLRDAGMDEDKEEHGRGDLITLAKHLSDYQIFLWEVQENEIVATELERFNEDGKKFIGLFYQNGHYEFVTHILDPKPARFCYKCSTFAGDNHQKECKARCKRCGSFDCQPRNERIKCDVCNICFKSQKCFDAHKLTPKAGALSHCEKYFYCQECLTYDRTSKYRGVPHVCGATSYCNTCRGMKNIGHECTHTIPSTEKKEKSKEKQKSWKVIVYDVECVVAESGKYNGNFATPKTSTKECFIGFVERGPKHEPNLICVRMFCNECRGRDGCQQCREPWYYSYQNGPQDEMEEDSYQDSDENQGQIIRVQKRYTPLARFGEFLLKDSRANGAYIIAHNGGRYDHVLMLAELDRQAGMHATEPKVILNGMTIITGEFKYKKQKLHFRDSMQFLAMGLAKMPEAFELTGEVKGFFPHLYNHPDNYGRVLDTLPDKEYYGPEFMRPEVREKFDEWHAECYRDGFNLHEELLKYCQSDVRILALTMIAFIEKCELLFNGWNPIIHGCTLASYIFFVLKNEYIKEGDVGYIPESGYGRDKNSILAYKYLQWLEKKNPSLKLQYGLKGGEHKISANGHNYSVDGYNKDTNEVFEVHGCLWHGCPKCNTIPEKKTPQTNGLTIKELYDRTKRREKDIEDAGYKLIVAWECEIRAELEKDAEMRKFFELNKYTRRLLPRDALYGGRTQAFRSITEAENDIRLDYYDFVSMYPYLNAGGTAYPRGNPQVIVDNLPDPNQPLTKRGIVFCDVLPEPSAPMGLLPQKIHKKLMFVLCRTCAEKQRGPCTHRKVSQRFITGAWPTDELQKAISSGYKVLKYHEIWHWPDSQWVTEGFFTDYIKPLLTLKHQSSGWPKENMSDKEKKEYVDWILEKDGVQLDPSKIQKNKAMRSLTKIFLNAAWGKFAQNPLKSETILIQKSDARTLTNFFNDSKFEPISMVPFGEDKLWISRKPKDEALRTTPFTNLAIAAITTSSARLRLTEAIERVGVDNMIYCDTDSLIFKRHKDEDPLGDLKGQQLGYLVNEIPKGSELVEVVTMAPKVYGLKVKNSDGTFTECVKAKGMTMTSENTGIITFDAMKKSMNDYINDGFAKPLEGKMLRFRRGDNALDGIWTCTMKKELNPRMDKGHYVDGVSIPYGQLPRGTRLINDYPF
ncbi:hypothetical protein B9Z55_028556 [Caenorhabditis nigoni]|nr:hypothetical protein B9Z55_028556 [Caenorhabditis nigoni]